MWKLLSLLLPAYLAVGDITEISLNKSTTGTCDNQRDPNRREFLKLELQTDFPLISIQVRTEGDATVYVSKGNLPYETGYDYTANRHKPYTVLINDVVQGESYFVYVKGTCEEFTILVEHPTV